VRVVLVPGDIFDNICVSTVLSHGIHIERGFANIPKTDNIVIRAREELAIDMRVPRETIALSGVTMTTMLRTTNVISRDRVVLGVIKDKDSGRGRFGCNNELRERLRGRRREEGVR
jgi:D-serine deaminase-like pyridoxal phosphate-dependent protein